MDPWPTGKNQEGPTLLEHFSVDNPMGEVELALGDMPVARLKLSCATPKEVRTLLSKELGVEFHVEVLKRREILASGLKWRKIGATAPDGGRKLDNPELAQALARKIQLNQSFEFTTQEVQAFGIDLHRSSSKFENQWSFYYIRSYFKLTAPYHSGWETLQPNHSGWETLQDRCNSCPTLTTSDPSGPPITNVSACTCKG